MIYILIPIFNEAGNIPNLFKELQSILPSEETFFVFSDDGSTDQSQQLLKEYFANTSYVVLGDTKNHGPGYAFNIGFEWIIAHSKSENDIVVTLEADCTSDFTLLPKMITLNRLGYSLVLASVYAQGGGFEKTSFFRKLLSAFANLLFRFVFNVKVLTLSSFYRAYSLSLLKSIKENNAEIIKESGFICMLEILLKAIKQKAEIVELPMVLRSGKRIGKSKMKIFRTSITYFIFLFKNRKNL